MHCQAEFVSACVSACIDVMQCIKVACLLIQHKCMHQPETALCTSKPVHSKVKMKSDRMKKRIESAH